VSAVGTSTCRQIPLSMDWERFPSAARMGREISEVLTTVPNDPVDVANNVLPPIVLGTLAFWFGYPNGGRRVAGCIDVVWSSGSAVGTPTCRLIPLSMDWGNVPAATRMGRETPEVLTTVPEDSVDVANSGVLPPIALGTLAFGFEYDSSGGRRVADCVDVVWSSGCALALGFGEGSSF
jgi:hypothetical protein